ncbi:MAG: hypothetical protein DRJ10_03000 [Bacteroidetes bacterium]|nr:MAG: hypothetical protein DRJ10_03000 [Bacteroidota bacterium]
MKQLVSRLHVYLIPESFRSDELKHRKARIYINATLITTLFAAFFLLNTLAFDMHYHFYSMIACTIFFFILAFSLRWGISLIVATHFFVGIAVISTFWDAYFLGGLQSYDLPWICIAPVLAILFGNSRIGWIWLAISIIAVLIMGALQLIGTEFRIVMDSQYYHLHGLNSLIALVLIMFIIVLIVEKAYTGTMAKLDQKNKIIEERNSELNSQNEEITTQRDQLSKQNKSISESILYAKRIQSAVLPPAAYINELLPENFILFKPRDEVSGDFYWIRQINQYIVIAVADCTGHGVPGAIMSMLGISFLNEIIQKREVTQANQALNELRKQIKQALRQTGKKGEADDGIDMALCALDSKTKILHYAGANNSIYLILNGELTEIKADRMPIGYYPNEKPTFTNHEIQLKDGDVFYLFSDGFMDQFGGKKGFKYKASNFQQILFENHGRPMVIQMELLEQELSNWMKGYEQTDDILVMGVRV